MLRDERPTRARRLERACSRGCASERWTAATTRASSALALALFAFQFERCAPYRPLLRGARAHARDVSRRWRDDPGRADRRVQGARAAQLPARARASTSSAPAARSPRARGELLARHARRSTRRRCCRASQRGVLPDLAPGHARRIRVLAPSPAESARLVALAHVRRVHARARRRRRAAAFVRGGALDATRCSRRSSARQRDARRSRCSAAPRSRSCTCSRRSSGAALRLALPAGARVMETGGFKGRSRELPRERALRLDRRPPRRPARAHRQPVRHDGARQPVLRLGAARAARRAAKLAPALGARPARRSGERRRGARRGELGVDHGSSTSRTPAACSRSQTADLGRAIERRLRGARPRARRRGARLLDRRRRDARVPERSAAADVRAARARSCATRGRRCAARSRRERVAVLGRVLERFRAPDSAERRRLERRAAGGDRLLRRDGARGRSRADSRPYTAAALRGAGRERARWRSRERRVARRASRPPRVLLGGRDPTPTLLALLARRSRCARPCSRSRSAHDPVTAPLFARALAAEDPELARPRRAGRRSRSDDAEALGALSRAECVVATARTQTIAAVRRAARPAAALRAARPPALARRARSRGGAAARRSRTPPRRSRSTSRSGTSSAACRRSRSTSSAPIQRGRTRRRGARGRARERGVALAARPPSTRAPPRASARARRSAELRGAGRSSCTSQRNRAGASSPSRMRGAAPAPLHRFVRVHPSRDADACLAALRPLGAQLAAVALAGFGAAHDALAAALARARRVARVRARHAADRRRSTGRATTDRC